MIETTPGRGSEEFEKKQEGSPWMQSEMAQVSQVIPIIRCLIIKKCGRILGLYQGPGRFSPERGHARDPEAPQSGPEGEQARPGLPAWPEAFAAGTTQLL